MAMEAGPVPSVRALGSAALLLAGLAGAALLGATFAGDGSDVDGILPVGGGALLVLAGVFVLVGLGRLPLPHIGRSGLAVVLALSLLCAWIGTTIVWSIAPDLSWDAFNRSLAFLAFLGLGIVLAGAAGPFAARLGATLLAVVTGVVLTWALVAKAIPALDPQGDRIGRLREPVEYWNALALIADVALALGLWLGVSRALSPRHSPRHSPQRPPGDPRDPFGQRIGDPLKEGSRDRADFVPLAGALLLYVATLALLLTLSRMGLVAGVAVVVLWLLLSRERVEAGLLLACSAVPGALVAGWAFTRPALVEDGAGRADRVADGAVFGVLALLGAALVMGLAVFVAQRQLAPGTRRRVGQALVVGAAVLALAAVAGLAVAVGDASTSRVSCSEVANDPGRFGNISFSNRRCWWAEAKDVFVEHAPEGAGAGTFEMARKRFRTDARTVSQPHSVPLQQLADSGVLGLGLFAALLVIGAAACACALRRLDGAERAATVALVAAPFAYLLHALVDYSWDFLAVTAPTTFALGVLVASGRTPGDVRSRPFLAIAAVVLAVATLVSFASPRLSERSVRASDRALDDDDFDRARDSARRAQLLNPYSVEPLFALARVAERAGRLEEAGERYSEAVELQPENPATWYALGTFEFHSREDMCAAYRALNRSWLLDSAGDQWLPGGELDVSREAVQEGACEQQ
jgi:hypothetical protein